MTSTCLVWGLLLNRLLIQIPIFLLLGPIFLPVKNKPAFFSLHEEGGQQSQLFLKLHRPSLDDQAWLLWPQGCNHPQSTQAGVVRSATRSSALTQFFNRLEKSTRRPGEGPASLWWAVCQLQPNEEHGGVIPNDKGDHYAAVKKKCYIEKPTPSQCVTSTILNKPKGLMSVASKVAVRRRICKLSGEPWAVDIPMKGTMVIG